MDTIKNSASPSTKGITPPQFAQSQTQPPQTSTPQAQTSPSTDMLENANKTTEFLKSLAHPGRLMILCRLAEGPATVGQLEEMLETSQSAVSKQLSRLREENFVSTKRQGRSIYYSLADERARVLVETLYQLFCDAP